MPDREGPIDDSHLTVFFAWQSLHPKANQDFIQAALDKAIRDAGREPTIEVPVRMDRDTRGMPGSPNIKEAIFAKIQRAAVVVADVSIVGGGADRRTPNPNVLIELGFAVGCLGWERVLCVCNTALGEVEALPFDLRGQRIRTYCVSPDAPDEERLAERRKLREVLRNDLLTMLPAAVAARAPTQAEQRDMLVADQLRAAARDALAALAGFLGSRRFGATEPDAQGLVLKLFSDDAETPEPEFVTSVMRGFSWSMPANSSRSIFAGFDQPPTELFAAAIGALHEEMQRIQQQFHGVANPELLTRVETLRRAARDGGSAFEQWIKSPMPLYSPMLRERVAGYGTRMRPLVEELWRAMETCRRFTPVTVRAASSPS